MKLTLAQTLHEALSRFRNRLAPRRASRRAAGPAPRPARGTAATPLDSRTRTAARPPTRAMATQQRLDPLGALVAWPLAPVLAAVAIGYAVTATILQSDQIHSPLLAALALFSMAAAGAALVYGALPSRAPFEPAMHLAIVGLAVAAHLFGQASMWGHNVLIQDDFGPLGTGLLLLGLAPYRPWREIAFSGTVAAVIFGAVAMAQAPYLGIVVPPVIYAIVAGIQVLAPAAAGAAYSRRIVRSILEWQSDARQAVVARTEETRGQLAQSVIESQLDALREGVIPFLDDVLERGTVSPGDIERAGVLADEVRRTLVAETENTWLDAVVARERTVLAERGLTPLLVVADPERRAAAFEAEQRAATAALIVALCDLRGFDPRSLVVQVAGPSRHDPAPREGAADAPAPHDSALHADTVTIQAGVDLPARALRRALGPYLGVLRVLFVRVKVTVRHPLLTIEFDDARDPQHSPKPRDTRGRPRTSEDGYPQ